MVTVDLLLWVADKLKKLGVVHKLKVIQNLFLGFWIFILLYVFLVSFCFYGVNSIDRF
jgi:hypothetical protein